MPPERSDLESTLAAKELAANKVLAVFDRAEASDFRALAAPGGSVSAGCTDEARSGQDPGFDKTRFIEALDVFDWLDPEEFDLTVDDCRQLRTHVSTWRRQLGRVWVGMTPG